MPIRGQQTPDTSYTQAILSGGLAAVDAARQSRRYGTQAMADGAPYSQAPAQQNDLYDQWLSQVTPQGYDLNYGRTDKGAYAGFKTASDLKAAMRGRAESLRHGDQQVFSALDQMANQGLDRVSGDYTSRSHDANLKDWTRPIEPAAYTAPNGWSTAVGNAPMGPVNPEFTDQSGTTPPAAPAKGPALARQANPEAAAKTIGDYGRKSYMANELDPWLAKESGKYLQQEDFAQQGLATPIANYAARAGAEYGIDPNIVAGWYPDSSRLTDYKDQRDLATLDATGMPYSDYNSALDKMTAQQTALDKQATTDQVDAQAQEINARVYDATGGMVDATKLASQTGVQPIDTLNIVASDAYQGYAAEIQAALDEATSTGDPTVVSDTMTSVLTQAAFQDPALYDVLSAVYGDYTPSGFDLYGGG